MHKSCMVHTFYTEKKKQKNDCSIRFIHYKAYQLKITMFSCNYKIYVPKISISMWRKIEKWRCIISM